MPGIKSGTDPDPFPFSSFPRARCLARWPRRGRGRCRSSSAALRRWPRSSERTASASASASSRKTSDVGGAGGTRCHSGQPPAPAPCPPEHLGGFLGGVGPVSQRFWGRRSAPEERCPQEGTAASPSARLVPGPPRHPRAWRQRRVRGGLSTHRPLPAAHAGLCLFVPFWVEKERFEGCPVQQRVGDFQTPQHRTWPGAGEAPSGLPTGPHGASKQNPCVPCQVCASMRCCFCVKEINI